MPRGLLNSAPLRVVERETGEDGREGCINGGVYRHGCAVEELPPLLCIWVVGDESLEGRGRRYDKPPETRHQPIMLHLGMGVIAGGTLFRRFQIRPIGQILQKNMQGQKNVVRTIIIWSFVVDMLPDDW